MLTPEIQSAFVGILNEELKMATGCTEPIALAYCAAKLRQLLGAEPEKLLAEVSGNILKNVKSVIVPNTGGLKGTKAAIAAGIVAGDANAELQVISSVDKAVYPAIAAYSERTPIEIVCSDTPHLLDIQLTGWAGGHEVTVRVADHHNNIVYIKKDGQVQVEKSLDAPAASGEEADRSLLSLPNILDFANEVDLGLVKDLLKRQLECNSAIAREGLKNSWGANIGSTLLNEYGNDIRFEARAWAAAGSDARMSGCELPVVIVSGSGNQGITASMPVYRYAKHLEVSEEKMYRALIVSDLVTCYQKEGIGVLSAYCGAVSAGVGAGAAIAYLQGADEEAIGHTIVNAVAILSGTICDGAKPSCAAKIAESVDAGLLGYQMYLNGNNLQPGDGIIGESLHNTGANVGVLAKKGMRDTDRTILKIMTQ